MLTNDNYIEFIEYVVKVLRTICHIIFDLSGLTYVSSAGMGSFISIHKHLKINNGTMVLTGIRDKVQVIFELLSFEKVFTLKAGMDEAIAFIRQGKTETGNIFPMALSCINCGTEFETKAASWYRCIHCQELLYIDESGKILEANP